MKSTTENTTTTSRPRSREQEQARMEYYLTLAHDAYKAGIANGSAIAVHAGPVPFERLYLARMLVKMEHSLRLLRDAAGPGVNTTDAAIEEVYAEAIAIHNAARPPMATGSRVKWNDVASITTTGTVEIVYAAGAAPDGNPDHQYVMVMRDDGNRAMKKKKDLRLFGCPGCNGSRYHYITTDTGRRVIDRKQPCETCST